MRQYHHRLPAVAMVGRGLGSALVRGATVAAFVLIGVTAAGLIDAFVVGSQRKKHERQIEARLGL